MTQLADDLAQIEDDAGNMKTDWQQLDEFRNQFVNDALSTKPPPRMAR